MTGAASTRRALLGSALLAPLAIAAYASPVTAITAADRSTWDRRFTEVLSLKAAMDAADVSYNSAYEAFLASLPPQPLDAIKREFPHYNHPEYVLHSLDIDAHEATLKSYPAEALRAQGLDDVAAIRRWRAAYRQARDASGCGDLADALDAAADAYSDAALALVLMPAPDLAAVAWKLEYMFGEDAESSSCWAIEYIRAVQGDVRRFAGEAA